MIYLFKNDSIMKKLKKKHNKDQMHIIKGQYLEYMLIYYLKIYKNKYYSNIFTIC